MSARLQKPLFGLDYTSPIPGATLKAGGVDFVYRYISRSSSKCLQRYEAIDLDAHDIGICLVFEDWGFTRGVESYSQGKADAEYALHFVHGVFDGTHMAVTQLRPIPSAVDTDRVSPSQAEPYFQGWSQVFPRSMSGPYGSKSMVTYLANKGYGCLFQTYAWSSGELDTRALVHQYSNDHSFAGHGVDFDHAYYEDYGQWNYKAPSPVDPFAVLLKSNFRFGTLVLNEYGTAMEARGALEHAQKYHTWLPEVYRRLKLLRDRVWFVVHNEYDPKRKRWVPRPKSQWSDEWTKFKRGPRWQVLNNEMKKIAKVVHV